MIDINLIRENPEKVKEALSLKGFESSLIDQVLELDKHYRQILQEVENLRKERNIASETKDIEKGRKVKEELQNKEPQLKGVEEELNESLLQIPNLPLDIVPKGKGEEENKVVRENGEVKKFDFEVKDHVELGSLLDIIDFEKGSKVAGTGFYYLKNEGALLELALVRYGLEFLQKKGFTNMITPDLAHSRFYLGTGYAPKGPEAQTYVIDESDLGLIATSEVTLAGYHADEVLEEGKLPLRYGGYSHCFRVEGGSYGKYSKGLYRVHQFTKVEMFVYAHPEESEKIHEELLKFEEEFWQSLKIPYRVLEMCTRDLGAQAARKFDLEAWMPGRNDWGEVTSTSNTTDYQARRLNIKIKRPSGESIFAHTLNGTLMASSRAIIAIMENYQEKDGSVAIPEVLRPYVGKDKISVE